MKVHVTGEFDYQSRAQIDQRFIYERAETARPIRAQEQLEIKCDERKKERTGERTPLAGDKMCD